MTKESEVDNLKTVTKKEYMILSVLYEVIVISANDDKALVRLEKK